MVDAVVSGVIELLGTILVKHMEEQVKLVVGIEEQIHSLTRKFMIIRAVLDDAEKRQVNESSVRLWLAELKDACYDAGDLLDEWSTAILKSTIEKKEETTDTICWFTNSWKVCSLFPFRWFRFRRLVLRHDISRKIKQLIVRLDAIEYERRTYNFVEGRGVVEHERHITVSVVDVSKVHGRDKDKDELLSMLLNESKEEVSGLCIISIVGMGGLGKTTLARLVYNEDAVKAHFDLRAWVCVSDPFNEKRVARSILEALSGVAPEANELQTLLNHMSHTLAGKRVFLVLDDVWTEDDEKWEQLRDTLLKCCSPGSRVLVTTRKDKVAKMLKSKHMLKPSLLSEEACWSVFSQVAFFGRNSEERGSLEDLGRNIVKKCNGLPFAAKVIGSLLSFKERREEWECLLYSKIWELDISERLFKPLLLSYYDLSSSVRRCFSYCAVLPKDCAIDKDELIFMWMAQGFLSSTRNMKLEEVGEEYFNVLLTRSFFQELDKDHGLYTMHDLVHDLARYLNVGECFLMEADDGDQETSEGAYHYGGKVRHLTMILERDTPFPVLVDVGKKLHSISIRLRNNYLIEEGALGNLFDQLTYLKTLEMAVDFIYEKPNTIRKLPENVGKLVLLRFLNLSGNDMLKELPESLCDLCNLQTLIVSYCSNLERLPRGMGKLVKLRHLKNESTDKLHFMPKGIKHLTSLITLDEFVVGEDGNDRERMTLGDLKSLKRLCGSLIIKRLGNLKDVEEAKQAIRHMKHIVQLELNFSGERAEFNEVVLEGLQPPPQLQQLRILNYGGTTMCPSWLPSLTKLTNLDMDNFENLECLPSLGMLPSLETLRVWGMEKVKTVDVGFMEATTDCSTSSVSSFIVFPKLKTLTFSSMTNWKEWKYKMTTEEECSGTKIKMPQLRYLYVLCCPKLKALPDFLLQTPNLYIEGCPILERRGKQALFVTSSKIENQCVDLKNRIQTRAENEDMEA